MKRFLNDQCTCFCLTTDRLCTSVFCFQIVQFTEIKGSGIAGVPTTVFIDKNGKVVGEAVVGAKVEEYKQHVEDYLNEQK